MPEPYPIINLVDVQPELELAPESMGSRQKFWYRPEEGRTDWLFKFPRENTGEHWAEKIAAEVASLIEVRHARVELAEFDGARGSATESFTRGGRVLFHGNQMLARIVGDYNPEKRFGQSSHTLENIWLALDRFFVSPESARKTKSMLARYLVMDALIGNTDRHHENWGVLWRRTKEHSMGLLAPSFDHASSLGRELADERRDRLLAENRVGNYSERGSGGIYWSEAERRGPSPLELVRRATCKYPDLLRPAVMTLERLDGASLREVVGRIPPDWMTPSAREFALALMCYNYGELRGLI